MQTDPYTRVTEHGCPRVPVHMCHSLLRLPFREEHLRMCNMYACTRTVVYGGYGSAKGNPGRRYLGNLKCMHFIDEDRMGVMDRLWTGRTDAIVV